MSSHAPRSAKPRSGRMVSNGEEVGRQHLAGVVTQEGAPIAGLLFAIREGGNVSAFEDVSQ